MMPTKESKETGTDNAHNNSPNDNMRLRHVLHSIL
jgi:hypothetical protein